MICCNNDMRAFMSTDRLVAHATEFFVIGFAQPLWSEASVHAHALTSLKRTASWQPECKGKCIPGLPQKFLRDWRNLRLEGAHVGLLLGR